MKLFIVKVGFLIMMGMGFALKADAYETAPAVPIGIAAGPSGIIEVSFPTMENPDGCAFNGAYMLNPTLDTTTKKSMLSLLITAKTTNRPVQVRLSGCSDRPLIEYVFLDLNW